MITFLQRYKVAHRMTAGFGLIIVLMLAITATGLYTSAKQQQHTDSIAMDRLGRTTLANQMLQYSNQVSVELQAAALTQDKTARSQALIRTGMARDIYMERLEQLLALPANEKETQLLQSVVHARDHAASLIAPWIELLNSDDESAAIEQLNIVVLPALQSVRDAISAVVENENAMIQAASAETDATARNARFNLIAITLIAAVVAIILIVSLTRSLTLPLARATQAALAMANGQLSGPRLQGGQDEPGELLQAIQAVRDVLHAVNVGLRETAIRHEQGEISFYPVPTDFPGDYSALVTEINQLIQSHVNAAVMTASLVQRYSQGDLSQDIPRMPGEKAQLVDAVDNVKNNIGLISQQILDLTQSAAKGDFSVRGDAARFQHVFRDMVENLNGLMKTTDGNLTQLSSLFKAIATGNLTARMDGHFEGVFATMRDDANTTVNNLTGIVGRIQHTTVSITTAASEIASGNLDLSRRTEQQAANLEETAASMEELTSTVRQNAEHARQANQLAIDAAKVAAEGGGVVRQAVATMVNIEQSSQRIADIISVIDGIAFQTNILALNAAVEAARAGEQGRGFAVVASEVRTLAQRSATAAKEIKTLIDHSVNNVAAGSILVRQAGNTMEDIVSSVQRVTDIIAEISAASQEQTSGIEQVSQTIIQMDGTTQQNAALVEEATASARALEEQAHQLSAAVSAFCLH